MKDLEDLLPNKSLIPPPMEDEETAPPGMTHPSYFLYPLNCKLHPESALAGIKPTTFSQIRETDTAPPCHIDMTHSLDRLDITCLTSTLILFPPVHRLRCCN